MFIEDYILGIAGYGKWVFASTTVDSLPAPDENFFESVASQIANGNALTEKQSVLAVRLLKNHLSKLDPRMFPNAIADLENPKWKMAFRVLPTVKTIKVGVHNQPAKYVNGKCILVEFPFDQYIVESFRKRNTTVHDLHKGNWDPNLKQWIFALTETNIAYVGDMLINKGFDADDEFLILYAAVLEVQENIEQHVPMLTQQSDRYVIANAHANIPQPVTKNLVDALFLARDYGITTWDDHIDNEINSTVNPTTKDILSFNDRNKQLWFNSNTVPIAAFEDLLNYGGPALIIIPGGNEAALVKAWTEFALSIGIDIADISVMFRLPNERADFNQYVRSTNLNNPVGANTRIVFVSTKITKPLVKSGVGFNTVINLGYYNYMHFTMSTVVDNAGNLVYYSMKEPTKNNKWQQHEL